MEGKPVKSVEIDYREPKKLDSFENKRVQATGKLSHWHGVETGERTVLEVTSIREAKAN